MSSFLDVDDKMTKKGDKKLHIAVYAQKISQNHEKNIEKRIDKILLF